MNFRGKMRFSMLGGLLAGLLLFAPNASAQTDLDAPIQIAPAFVIDRYRTKAEEGDARSMFRMGMLEERGLVSGTPDLAQAAGWFLQAAEAGLLEAQFRRATMYETGTGGVQDYAEAAKLYSLAAQQGMAEAQFNLAILLQTGRAGAHDIPEAIRWYEQAAFRGIVPAMRALGVLYVAGVGNTPQDAIEAWAWLTWAAENGDGDAAEQLPPVEDQLDDAAAQEARELLEAYRQLRISS